MINVRVKETPAINVYSKSSKTDVDVQGAVLVGAEGGQQFNNIKFGDGLKLEKTVSGDVLSVDTSKSVEENNTLPITSAAVYTEVGNINALLKTI